MCRFILLLPLLFSSYQCTEAPLATTTSGQVRGYWSTSTQGRDYASFSGIPYAKPPVGSLRFLRPQEPEPWTGVREATQQIKCTQRNEYFPGNPLQGQEDCLVLNIFTPQWPAGNASLLPVMVFIHGGGYKA